MSGGELGQSVGAVGTPTVRQARAAAVHVADRIGAEHPHELDDVMPRLAGRQLAQDPAIAAGGPRTPRRARAHPTAPTAGRGRVVNGLIPALAIAALLWAAAYDAARNNDRRIAAENDEEADR